MQMRAMNWRWNGLGDGFGVADDWILTRVDYFKLEVGSRVLHWCGGNFNRSGMHCVELLAREFRQRVIDDCFWGWLHLKPRIKWRSAPPSGDYAATRCDLNNAVVSTVVKGFA